MGEVRNAAYPWGPIVYGQGSTYCEAIERSGGVPVLIPLMFDLKNLEQVYTYLDGILFAGGNDINPELYEELPHKTSVDFSERRDSAEILLLEWALKDKKPVLGICRGMQLINVTCGGTLYQNIPTDIQNAIDHTACVSREDPNYLAHNIEIDPLSRLSQILKIQSLQTNSLHHQAVKDIGKNLRVSAQTHDGVIEAIESADESYVFGLQCHPESLEAKDVPEFRKLFKSFTDAAAVNKPFIISAWSCVLPVRRLRLNVYGGFLFVFKLINIR